MDKLERLTLIAWSTSGFILDVCGLSHLYNYYGETLDIVLAAACICGWVPNDYDIKFGSQF